MLPKAPDMMAKPELEAIPLELQILILKNVPGLETLRNLVQASPLYHKAYLAGRKEVLCAIVQQLLGRVHIAEAIAAVRSEAYLLRMHPIRRK
ncbi:hypothetical protein AJ79_01456 [Helicocarpus griseus UAMH5409]|uniref:F-box domain-containing protein n=1 Tax=Helicocarpus griseus UAMH5409 TaxID=1447875 RepID=A0A2B7Y7F4_9EURO|nr:hypothetical protein AJ79_01456 [Helicocarpus griseus UAMH5409]